MITRNFLIFVLAAVLPVMAEVMLQPQTFGVRAGFVFPEPNIQETFGIGMQSTTGTLATNTRLRIGMDYWASRWSQASREQTWRLFSLKALAVAEVPIRNYPVVPYTGGGLGFTVNHWQRYGNDIPTRKNTDVDLAIMLVGGLRKELAAELFGFFELQYTIAGNMDYLGVWLGVSHIFRR